MTSRTKKTTGVVNSEQSDKISVITPDDNSAPLSVAKRDAAKARQVSLKELAALLDRDRNTVVKYVDGGMPFIEKADRDLGKAWIFDVADCVRWLEKRAADVTADKFGDSPDGQMTEDEAKRRRAVAQAIVAELDMLERLRAVIPVSDALEWWAKDYGEIKAKAMSLPDKLAVAVDPSLASHIRALADKHMREVMETCKTENSLLKWS